MLSLTETMKCDIMFRYVISYQDINYHTYYYTQHRGFFPTQSSSFSVGKSDVLIKV